MAFACASTMKEDDITQCSVCLETYKEPKALPCLHSFCLQCLDRTCEGKGQNVPCPLCRKVYTIPPGGNVNLLNNYVLLQLLQINPSTRKAENILPSSKNIKSLANYCNQHPGEKNRLYCYDCKMVTCNVCIVNKHRKHDLIGVNESAKKFRKQINVDVDNVSAQAARKVERIKRLEVDRSLFMKKVTITQNEISQKYDQLISLIKSQKSQLMEDLNVCKNNVLKDVETQKDEIERQFEIAESFTTDALEIMKIVSACDISHAGHELHARAVKLLKNQEKLNCNRLSAVEITFKPSLSTTDNVKNFVGELVFRDETMLDFTKFLENLDILNIMPSTEEWITGITALGSEVFVVGEKSQVNVYKSDDFTLIRNLMITESYELSALVSCSHYNCLYAADLGQRIIYRYDLTNNVITNWSVGQRFYRLSVSKCHNVLATLWDTNQIQEYNTHGSLISEITLDGSIDHPIHCVQLTSGNYVVSHMGKQCRVCLVDQSGRIIQSYGGSRGSGVRQLDGPCQLSVDAHDNVLVADHGNNKVQLLSPTLTYISDMWMQVSEHRLNEPCNLHVDELNHRLYIAQWCRGRIFSFGVMENE